MRSSRSIRRWGAAAFVAAVATAATLVALPAGTAQAQAQAGCLTADYQPSIWDISTGGGFVAGIVLTNDCGTAVSGWTLVLTYGETDVMLLNSWGGDWRQEGDQIIGESQPGSWNDQIGPGAALHVGFVASFTGAYHDPTMCSVNGGPCDPAPNQPPEVSVAMPADDSGLSAPCPGTLIAAASDPDGAVDRVEFYLNDEPVGTADTAPYQVEVPSTDLDDGENVVVARAFDDQDASTDSEPVTFTYLPPPPGLVIIDCVAGSLPVLEGGSQAAQLSNSCAAEVEVTATVSGDPGITVTPESFVFPLAGTEVTVSAAPGTAGATATVTLSTQSNCFSASFPVAVTDPTGPGNQPPEVSMAMPTEATTLLLPCPATLIAAASDPDGVVDRVEFYLNGEVAGTADTAPYQVEVPRAGLNSSANNTVTARAFDDGNASADSEPVTFSYLGLGAPTPIVGCAAGPLPVVEGGSQAVPVASGCSPVTAPEVTVAVSGDPGISVAPESITVPEAGGEVTVSAAPGTAGATAIVSLDPVPDICIGTSFQVAVTEG